MYLKYISVLAIQLKIQTARRTFRVNAKKQDYVNVIVKALDEAKDGKKKYIELSARDVARMTGMQPVMSTCCSVMKQMMVEGDKIVKDSRSKNGYDSHLTVKYQVGDRADKKPMFDIRRGKPKGAAGRREILHVLRYATRCDSRARTERLLSARQKIPVLRHALSGRRVY